MKKIDKELQEAAYKWAEPITADINKHIAVAANKASPSQRKTNKNITGVKHG